jgi:hypothetical protein
VVSRGRVVRGKTSGMALEIGQAHTLRRSTATGRELRLEARPVARSNSRRAVRAGRQPRRVVE